MSGFWPDGNAEPESAGEDDGMSDETTDLISAVRELHKPAAQHPGSVDYRCDGCDEGIYAEGPPAWPCRTAEIVYTAAEIAAVRA